MVGGLQHTQFRMRGGRASPPQISNDDGFTTDILLNYNDSFSFGSLVLQHVVTSCEAQSWHRKDPCATVQHCFIAKKRFATLILGSRNSHQ